MLNLSRTHDFQIHLSPSQAYPAAVNPPSFNWPENLAAQQYRLELKNLATDQQWRWEQVNSPMQLSFKLPDGRYQWRLIAAADTSSATSDLDRRHFSQWIEFEISADLPYYLAPTAKELFEKCDGHRHWLMYFDEDIKSIKAHSVSIYPKLKHTATHSAPVSEIRFPSHYRRGQEEGKREAIANVRKWIDRDLMVHALLYRIWGEQSHGVEAMQRLLRFAEWSLAGPASLLRPCTWGDEVGCSLARNVFLAYHWLSPLLNDNEKDLLVRPMLVRLARQISQRLSQDNLKQYPGHTHTSRLPSYLGLAGLSLYREHDRSECQQWLTDALEVYRGVLPFYGGTDGSWVDGPFYASTYSKWFHPFFLSVERLSDFSFYEHPFYKNFLNFARDFIAPEQSIHPFGDGFWCRRDGKEWPGFFSQNPLRIYAARFGDQFDNQQSQDLEESIEDYRLHLLDVVPTVKQIAFEAAAKTKQPDQETLTEQQVLNHFYSHAGLGKLTQRQLSLYYRSSRFGNSSHRHGDQGNIAFFDNGVGILVPTGSFGYRFGSDHHNQWTRQTKAHNLPLVGQLGQKLDDPSATARVLQSKTESSYHFVTLDLSKSYDQPLERFVRTIVLVDDYGLFLLDSIELNEPRVLNWRLHSPLNILADSHHAAIALTDPDKEINQYKCQLLSHPDVRATNTDGYLEELSIPGRAIESDANDKIVHINWQLAASRQHQVVACCVRENSSLAEAQYLSAPPEGGPAIQIKLKQGVVSIPVSTG